MARSKTEGEFRIKLDGMNYYVETRCKQGGRYLVPVRVRVRGYLGRWLGMLTESSCRLPGDAE